MSDTHAQTVAYSRDTMLPAVPPPRRETGAVRWLRENLFTGPLNILLTLLAAWALWVVLGEFLPWAVRGIWRAESLAECRTIRDQLYAAGTSVACWGVITDRWEQLVFGFYPRSGYWRPPLAFVLFLVAILPVLFSHLPRALLWFTAAAPFIIYWLLWGGSLGGPIAVALGLALAATAAVASGRAWGLLVGLLAGLLVFLLIFLDPLSWLLNLAQWLWSLLGAVAERTLGVDLAPIAALDSSMVRSAFPLIDHLAPPISSALQLELPRVASRNFGGFTLSIIIGLSAIALSLPLGILLALGRRSDMLFISLVSVVYIEVIRGVPLIVWLFSAQLLLNYFLPRGTNFDLMLRVIIMATLFAAAYIAEVIRGGLAALPRGQTEAADALGLDYWQAMRLVVLPQALKISIPGIVNTFIGLFKDTTLVAFIGLYDPIGLAKAIRADTDWNGIYWELYVFIAAVFFVFCFAMSRYSIWLERRLERSHR